MAKRERNKSFVLPDHPARAEWSTFCAGWVSGGCVVYMVVKVRGCEQKEERKVLS